MNTVCHVKVRATASEPVSVLPKSRRRIGRGEVPDGTHCEERVHTHRGHSPLRLSPPSRPARARLFRFLPVFALLLAALPPFAATPAAAAVLVSNLGQTESSTGTLGATHAQGFTTGSYAAGYDLTSIEVHIKTISVGDWPKMRAELWSDNSGAPGAHIANLTAPSTEATGAIAFSAPQNTRLMANTVYHFVIYSNDGTAESITITNTDSNSEDVGAATGWSIANGSHWFAGHSPTPSTSWTTFNKNRRILVNGSGPSSNANLSGLTASSGTSA